LIALLLLIDRGFRDERLQACAPFAVRDRAWCAARGEQSEDDVMMHIVKHLLLAMMEEALLVAVHLRDCVVFGQEPAPLQ